MMKFRFLTKDVTKRAAPGFTIMEFLIATFAFGTLLVGISAAIMQISRVYYKGAAESAVQDAARSIVDTIAQGIQFNGGAVTPTTVPAAGVPAAFCAGGQQYTYQIGHKLVEGKALDSTEKFHALVVKDVGSMSVCPPPVDIHDATLLADERELLAPSMRLSKLTVTNVGDDMYKINVRIIYGDDDLICSPASNGECNSEATTVNNLTSGDLTCRNTLIGTQFCAVSDVTAFAVKRVQ